LVRQNTLRHKDEPTRKFFHSNHGIPDKFDAFQVSTSNLRSIQSRISKLIGFIFDDLESGTVNLQPAYFICQYEQLVNLTLTFFYAMAVQIQYKLTCILTNLGSPGFQALVACHVAYFNAPDYISGFSIHRAHKHFLGGLESDAYWNVS